MGLKSAGIEQVLGVRLLPLRALPSNSLSAGGMQMESRWRWMFHPPALGHQRWGENRFGTVWAHCSFRSTL